MLLCATTRISRIKRFQFRGRRALAGKVSKRHQRLGVHARVIVVEHLAQLPDHSLDSRMLWLALLMCASRIDQGGGKRRR